MNLTLRTHGKVGAIYLDQMISRSRLHVHLLGDGQLKEVAAVLDDVHGLSVGQGGRVRGANARDDVIGPQSGCGNAPWSDLRSEHFDCE